MALISPFVFIDGQPNGNENFFSHMLHCIFKAFYKQYRRVHQNVCANSKPFIPKRAAKSLFVSAFIGILGRKKSRYKKLLKSIQDSERRKNKKVEKLDITRYQKESEVFSLIR